MTTRKSLARLGVIVTAIVTALAIATPAHAAYPNAGSVYPSNHEAGVVTFDADGDVVIVCDTDADGSRITAHVEVSFIIGRWAQLYDTYAAGNGTCTRVDAGDSGVYDLPEGIYVKLWVCIGRAWASNNTCRWDYFQNNNS